MQFVRCQLKRLKPNESFPSINDNVGDTNYSFNLTYFEQMN